LVEKRSGTTIPEGSNPDAQPRLLTLDPVIIRWRPLIYYLLVALGDFIMKQVFIRVWGMTLGSRYGLDYLVRVPPTWDACKGPTPIVFAHGLGIGLLQYSTIIYSFLTRVPDRPLFILLQPHVSQQIFHPRFLVPKNRKETVIAVRKLLINFGWVPNPADAWKRDAKGSKPRGVTMTSHSNGSFIHAWLLKDAPELVARSLFIDPVTFCCWEGGTWSSLCFFFFPCSRTSRLRPLSKIPLQPSHHREHSTLTQLVILTVSSLHLFSFIGSTASYILFLQHRNWHCQLASKTVRLGGEHFVF